jgi:DNA-binding IclR family transcriptional regulator
MNLIQEIIWARAITPRDQILLLRLLDTHGLEPFDASVEELAEMMSVPKSSIYECVKRLKNIDWLETTPVYLDGTYRRLKKRAKTQYRIKMEVKPEF